ncbi:excinuclease ABC subunit A, partial [Klebsiella pneumoniae]|uniref:hypothetical protein n=1 Tax=Klebsiella pneumoniae TaxID=573 RepID=UPI001BAACCF7
FASTLSGPAVHCLSLARQIDARLSGVLLVLDVPSLGLHQRYNERMLGTLIQLRQSGHTGIVVDHNEDAIGAPDQVIHISPGAVCR